MQKLNKAELEILAKLLNRAVGNQQLAVEIDASISRVIALIDDGRVEVYVPPLAVGNLIAS